MPELASVPPPPAEAPRVSAPAATSGGTNQARSNESPLLDRPSREEFLAVYEGTGRNVRATSKHFAKDRRQIYRWLELFGIER